LTAQTDEEGIKLIRDKILLSKKMTGVLSVMTPQQVRLSTAPAITVPALTRLRSEAEESGPPVEELQKGLARTAFKTLRSRHKKNSVIMMQDVPAAGVTLITIKGKSVQKGSKEGAWRKDKNLSKTLELLEYGGCFYMDENLRGDGSVMHSSS